MRGLRFSWVVLFWALVFSVFGCSAQDFGPHTATSVESMRVQTAEVSDSKAELFVSAELLGCSRVEECWKVGQHPDVYTVATEWGKEEIYVWSHKYSDFGESVTTLYVAVNRPKVHSWDLIALEWQGEKWNYGVYGGFYFIGETPYTRWYKGVLSQDQFPVALGMADEPWAVIARPVDTTGFKYIFEPGYWK